MSTSRATVLYGSATFELRRKKKIEFRRLFAVSRICQAWDSAMYRLHFGSLFSNYRATAERRGKKKSNFGGYSQYLADT